MDRKPEFVGLKPAHAGPDTLVYPGPGAIDASGNVRNPKVPDGRGWRAFETLAALGGWTGKPAKDAKAVKLGTLLETSAETSDRYRPGAGYRRDDLRHDASQDRRFGQLVILRAPGDAAKGATS